MRRIMTALFIIALVGLTPGILFASGTGGGSASSSGTSSSTSTAKAPTTALDWYNAGYTASGAGQYKEAAIDFTNAIALKSDYAEAYNMLGYCTRKLGDVTKAFTYYDKALKLKPNFPEAREYYGEAYLQLGNLPKAVQQYIILVKGGNTKVASELLDQIDSYVNKIT
jgi:tetratricopeptide (TPR) repeat protein